MSGIVWVKDKKVETLSTEAKQNYSFDPEAAIVDIINLSFCKLGNDL